jgi:hypothetical protein
MRTTLTPKLLATLFVSLGLTACDSEPTPPVASVDGDAAESEAANQLFLAQMNADRELTSRVLDELKKTDPSVTDAYFMLDENGQRTLTVVRDRGDGTVETWEAPASALSQIEDSATSAAKDSNAEEKDGFSASNAILPMLGGMLAGYMIANAFSARQGQTIARSKEAHERQRRMSSSAYTSSVGANSRRMASAGVRTPSQFANRASATRAPVGQSSGGSFSSSGTRSGGYSAGG